MFIGMKIHSDTASLRLAFPKTDYVTEYLEEASFTARAPEAWPCHSETAETARSHWSWGDPDCDALIAQCGKQSARILGSL